MLTHQRVLQYITAEGRLVNATDSVQGDGELSYDGTITHNATPANSEVEVDIAFDDTKLKSVLLYATVATVIRTNANHSGAPDDTITLVAGQALVWNSNDVAANPFTAAVTKLYITDSSATLDSAVKIRVLLDVTP